MPLYTNLIPHHGAVAFPTVNIDQHAAHPDATMLTIDLEGEASDPLSSAAIYSGSEVAILHAIGVIDNFRTGCPKAKLGWYWFPPVSRKEDVEPAKHYRPLVELADFACPSLYSLHARDLANLRRAKWWDKAMAKHGFPRLPRIGYVCESNLDGTKANTAQIRAQCKAAKAIGCESIYVWSGVPHLVWLAKLDNLTVADHFNRRAEAWTRLMNDYGFKLGDSFSHADIDREFAAYSENVLSTFKECMG